MSLAIQGTLVSQQVSEKLNGGARATSDGAASKSLSDNTATETAAKYVEISSRKEHETVRFEINLKFALRK